MSNVSCAKSSDPVSLQAQLTVARKEIHNLRQQLISLNHVHKKEVETIYKKLEDWQCLRCRNGEGDRECEPLSQVRATTFRTISTHFPERGTPRQPGICNDMIAKLTLNNTIFTNPDHALEGLQEFSHMWILFHFHRNDSGKSSSPRLNGIRTGVFATRSPHRPSPIGLSLVKIDRIMENTIYFSGVDMLDQTPVLDIKPYIPQYDNPGLSNTYFSEESVLDIRSNVGDSVSKENNLSNTPEFNSNEASTSTAGNMNNSIENLDVRVMDGEENERRDHVLGAASTENDRSATEESFYSRSASRMGEREAPDGEEEESPSTTQATTITTNAVTPEVPIRIPSWIDQPPVPRLMVLFKERAITQLNQLGPRGREKRIL
ncbi:hypothetical protein NQ317_010485 [Molorchus minor]|uniref:TsaA-like domain-containing protein n=1 Tax=Molorchus minor TaxID=1323400 RepID=A0ABQ9K1E5_9CUCU|nr:hypothetical protein NQ317_010485 [Molorchus minor]